MLDIKEDFPLLANYNSEGTLIYVDNAATTQKPQCVLDARVAEWYGARNANPHRGSYKLGSYATELYELSPRDGRGRTHQRRREGRGGVRAGTPPRR